MNGLFLDDERVPTEVTWLIYAEGIEWTIVRTFEAFTQALLQPGKIFEVISFDHDLQDFTASGQELTGYTCFKWMHDRCLDGLMNLPECLVHSKNGVGAENIARHYDNLRRHLGAP
ncbi:hypothetical protein IFT48_04265 [Pseudomonas fluorescens]|uniref:cyclic-phosphate processing receiver domain-containing protein n=1 Tax=Pseudomonas fluorescens TaxID=294 RepID=UPI001930C94B|nr:cyclic-phosphate processing receiver domain-containing protein [Pseudomonas fluorescens]MBD8089186.1 hypothetical protein [Pseudomonas fluorescens]